MNLGLPRTYIVGADAIPDDMVQRRVSELERDVARVSTQKTAAMAENLVLRDNIWRKGNEISDLRAQLERKDREISEIGSQLQQVPWRVISVYRKCRRLIPLPLLKLAGRAIKVPANQ
jgi:hypothetical protein